MLFAIGIARAALFGIALGVACEALARIDTGEAVDAGFDDAASRSFGFCAICIAMSLRTGLEREAKFIFFAIRIVDIAFVFVALYEAIVIEATCVATAIGQSNIAGAVAADLAFVLEAICTCGAWLSQSPLSALVWPLFASAFGVIFTFVGSDLAAILIGGTCSLCAMMIGSALIEAIASASYAFTGLTFFTVAAMLWWCPDNTIAHRDTTLNVKAIYAPDIEFSAVFGAICKLRFTALTIQLSSYIGCSFSQVAVAALLRLRNNRIIRIFWICNRLALCLYML